MTSRSDRVSFWVPGDPVPWQRARGGRSSHRYTAPTDRAWRGVVGYYARASMRGSGVRSTGRRELIERPVFVETKFFIRRPKKGRLLWPTGPRDPDTDNLRKAVLDALQGIVYSDDRLVVGGSEVKLWAGGDLPGPGVSILVALASQLDISAEAWTWTGGGDLLPGSGVRPRGSGG